MNRLAAVIFDMDGVLIDSHALHLRAWRQVLRAGGRKLRSDEEELLFDGGKREQILRHFLGEVGPEELRRLSEAKDALVRGEEDGVQLLPGALELLKALAAAGIPRALASSGSRPRVLRTLERLKLAAHFDVVVSGDDVSSGKPDPELFRIAAAKLGVRPEAAIVLEDAVSGVKAAKAAGMRCIAVAAPNRGKQLEQAGADAVVHSLAELSVARLRLALEPSGSHP